MNTNNTKKTAEVTIIRNGPIKVTGNFTITDIDNCILKPNNPEEIYVCACGRSQNKPYCDGSHKK